MHCNLLSALSTLQGKSWLRIGHHMKDASHERAYLVPFTRGAHNCLGHRHGHGRRLVGCVWAWCMRRWRRGRRGRRRRGLGRRRRRGCGVGCVSVAAVTSELAPPSCTIYCKQGSSFERRSLYFDASLLLAPCSTPSSNPILRLMYLLILQDALSQISKHSLFAVPLTCSTVRGRHKRGA